MKKNLNHKSAFVSRSIIFICSLFILTSCSGTKPATAGRQVIIISPEVQAAAYASRGIESINKGNFNNAISDFRKSVSLAPSYERGRYEKILGMAYGARGAYKGMNGYLSSAISDLELCLSLMPDDSDRKPFEEILALLYMGRGSLREQYGNYNGAGKDYLKALINSAR